jgi:hypothetical protein
MVVPEDPREGGATEVHAVRKARFVARATSGAGSMQDVEKHVKTSFDGQKLVKLGR